MIAGSLLLGVMILLMPDYRKNSQIDAFQIPITSFDVDASVSDMLSGERAEEFRQAVTLVGIAKSGHYGYGARIYNKIIKDYIPTLIIGASTVSEVLAGGGLQAGNLMLLGGLSTISIVLGTFAGAAALRTTME